jgi:predicted O-methyltransferase YrrM
LNFFSLFKRNLLYKFKKKTNIDLDVLDNKSLDELFVYFGSDKSSLGHGFSDFYSKYLNKFKDKDIKILEIGSYAGASAAAFAKHFLNSKIYCFDINISKFTFFSKKIDVYGLDIKNIKKVYLTIDEIINNSNKEFFDIIIDDGSHYLSDILCTFKTLFKYVKNKGYYVIEDYKHPNYYAYNKDVDDILVDEMLKKISQKKIFNSNLINQKDQIFFHKNIDEINIYKGNLKDSDICFIKKR